MVNSDDIKQAAQLGTDEDGHAIVKIPLELWEQWVAEDRQTKNERLLALLKSWENDPDEMPAAWWDDFDAFLKSNRLDLT